MARISIFLITAALIAGMAGCDDYPYTPSHNLKIRTWYDLDAVRNNLDGNHTLMNDLDSTTPGYEELASPTANGGKGWQPIVVATRWSIIGFESTFDGQGYEIRDLFINHSDEHWVGLFGSVGGEGVIKDVGVVNATVTGYSSDVGGVGGLVGVNEGIVNNSYCTGNVAGDSYVGGLVGYNVGAVKNSYSTGSVTSEHEYAGGLVGVNGGDVSNSYSNSRVTGDSYVGGLVGYNGGGGFAATVSDSYSTGYVTGNKHVGGLVGLFKYGTVSDSFWDTETSVHAPEWLEFGTGKTTAEMKSIATFSGAGWNIIAVALNQTDPAYIWNIVDNVTYPFLSWQS